MSTFKRVIGFVGCFAVTFTAAAIGAAASVQAATFYQQLSRPSWAPPANVFGPVWTFLYCCMGFAAWLIWRQRSERKPAALVVYAVQLGLNALWSWLFFAWRQGQWAFIEVLALWGSILLTLILFWRISRPAALLLVPYFAWVSFAACLTFAVWRLNPQLLP